MLFRSDILRGVRLFFIAFAAILLCLLAYQLLRPSAEAQGTTQAAAASEQSGPAQEDAAAEQSSEPRPLVVPPPPPVAGEAPAAAPPVKVPRPRRVDSSVPPPPPIAPVVRVSRPTPPTPSPREFEAPEVGSPKPPAPVTVTETTPAPEQNGVGYKSLLDADPNRPPAEAAVQPAPTTQEPAKKPDGNRIKRGLGRIFRVGKKDTTQPQP